MADKAFHLPPTASWSTLLITLPLIYFSAAPLVFLNMPLSFLPQRLALTSLLEY